MDNTIISFCACLWFQIFSLPFWARVPTILRLLPLAAYMGVIVWCYSWIRDAEGRAWVRMQEVLRIPAVYYLYLPVTWLLLYACHAIERGCNGPEVPSKAAQASPTVRALWLSGAMLVYGVHVGLAIACEYLDVQVGLIVLMIAFVGIFISGVTISMMFLKQAIPYRITSGEDRSESTLRAENIQPDLNTLNTHNKGTTNASFKDDMELN